MTTRFDFRSGRPLSLDHLAHGRLWLGLGAVLVASVVVGSLVRASDAPGFLMVNDKVTHLCAYATLMAWFAQLFRHDLTRLLLAAGFVALGLAMELLQGMVPSRQGDVFDMLANTSGVLLAWSLSYTRFGELLPTLERTLLRTRDAARGRPEGRSG